MTKYRYFLLTLFYIVITCSLSLAQPRGTIRWTRDGNGYYAVEQNEIVQYTLPQNTRKVIVAKIIPGGQSEPLKIESFSFSDDQNKVLIYTNSKRVWRINTRGEYWVLNLTNNTLKKIGSQRPPSSLMFAKFSPDGSKVAFVSEQNIFVEDLLTAEVKQLTKDGSRHFIYGTFDWVYEEEFMCRDGIRWSPDSRTIAFWHLDARKTRDFYMINNTDSIYSRVIPVEYPKVGEDPSACRVGLVDVGSGAIEWMNIPGDPSQHYITRMDFIPGTKELLVQQLNRKQNELKIHRYNPATKSASMIYTEMDEAWIDVANLGPEAYQVDFRYRFEWINSNKEFLWLTEKDGWNHIYRISIDGKSQKLVTAGNFDVIDLSAIDTQAGYVHFTASPENATQKYLFRTKLDGNGKLEMLTPKGLSGTHNYTISPNGKYARHSFSNTYTQPVREMISLPKHSPLDPAKSIATQLPKAQGTNNTEFFKVKTSEGITLDGWMVKPANFDPTKKYPIVFYVYTEPASQTVTDTYGASENGLYAGDMRADGYIYVSVDNRGTPAPKGRAWRKSIYKKVGQLNISDQAEAAKEILKWPFVDADRVAVWGWSGGGSATLNLMFQYPEIYKTGIAIAAVSNQLTYDNIYQERYMGLPQEDITSFTKGSPITYAKNLSGNLLYIHGTGDDNVHYQNAELLINEFIKHNKLFQLMIYPNRTHNINEGEGTDEHLATTYTNFLRLNCPPGPKQ